MVRHGRTEFSEQKVLNFGLDDSSINPPTSIRGSLWYVDGAGWVRTPFLGKPPRMTAQWSGNTMIYQGWNLRYNASKGDADWIITKRVYSGNYLIDEQTQVGEWDEREGTMSWDI